MGADRVTQGPLNSTGTNPYDQQALLLDARDGTLSISGTSRKIHVMRKCVTTFLTQTALAAITTAQNLLSFAFNSGALNVVNRTIVVRGYVIYSTTVGNVATISIALTLGGVTLCTITTAASNTAASANLPLQFEFELNVVTVGTTATIESHGKVLANLGTVAAGAASDFLDTNVAVSAAVNLVSAATLTVSIAGSAAIPSAQLRRATVEITA